MDFGKPLLCEEGVTVRSKIRLLPVTSSQKNNNSTDNTTTDDNISPTTSLSSLDQQVVAAANQAALDLFQPHHDDDSNNDDDRNSSPNNNNNSNNSNALFYPERVLPTARRIAPGSLVVILESFHSLTFVYATPGAVFSNRHGHFCHDDFIHKPYGSKIRSRSHSGFGFVHLLRPTPELWARSLPHRTQIVHELDASVMVLELRLRPNMVVAESGTGSGAMSHCLLRTIAPGGRLHTYEFHEKRAHTAREEFQKHGVDHLVTVHHWDVCGKVCVNHDKGESGGGGDDDEQQQKTSTTSSAGGFVGLGPATAHAVVLDLPEPWLAVPHAAHVLRPNGRLASYSPCVEQSQRAVEVMQKCGFHSIKTLEARLREHYVDEVEWEDPPKQKRPREKASGGGGEQVEEEQTCRDAAVAADGRDDGDAKMENVGNDDAVFDEAGTSDGVQDQTVSSSKSQKEPQQQQQQSTLKPSMPPARTVGKRKRLCARPFANMRGHTAFLTFATAGNKPQQPDVRAQDRTKEESSSS